MYQECAHFKDYSDPKINILFQDKVVEKPVLFILFYEINLFVCNWYFAYMYVNASHV